MSTCSVGGKGAGLRLVRPTRGLNKGPISALKPRLLPPGSVYGRVVCSSHQQGDKTISPHTGVTV